MPDPRKNPLLAPGAVIGILGGGQLGRMTALAAARLGYYVHVYCPDPLAPANQVSNFSTTASYDDLAQLTKFARSTDVVTFEFENIPITALSTVSEITPVLPNCRALEIAQDRVVEKDFLSSLGIATTAYWSVRNVDELEGALKSLNGSGVLKSARLGYDGRNQTRVDSGDQASVSWRAMGSEKGILEEWVTFEQEISVIVARSDDGMTEIYDPVQNCHRCHILETTIAPAPIEHSVAETACGIACEIAQALDLVGLLCVEMFLTPDSDLLVNEIAPRPHNSGHWTIDACATSQFEQLVRAICGIPLGSTARHSDAEMHNLIGDAAENWLQYLAEPGARLHLYGKSQTRPGRKMGHVTRLKPITAGIL